MNDNGETTEVIASNRVAAPPPNVKSNGAQGGAPNGGNGEESSAERPITLRDVRGNEKIRAYIEKANEQMAAIGYSEHGLRHAALVAAIARNICLELGF